jgi:outer membrane receptor for ferrienterochelin and colicin
MRLIRTLGALALLAFAATAASAQATGGLKIRVVDNSDKSAVIGAAVTLSSANKLVATTTLLTDAQGVVLFPVLRAGAGYIVTVIMDGYAGIRQETSVSIGSTKDVALALVPELSERVVVTGEKTSVDIDQNETSTKFSSDFIADLPVAGRFYQNVLALAPGVQDPDKDGNPNVNGARERDFKTQVGGISNVDPLTGTFLNLVTSDSIEDLTVITAGAGAEFGRAQGGFAQIIQKQGSNDFEGVFGMLYGSKLLDGNGATNVPSYLVPDFHVYQPSLQVSGPIVKDQLWYRFSGELIRREDPLVLAAGGDLKTVGTRRNSYDAQVTWQVSNRNKLAFNFRTDPLKRTNVGISAVTPSESTETNTFGGPTYTMTWTAPYSPSLLVDTTVAYQDTKQKFYPTQRGVANECTAVPWMDQFQCFDVQQGVTSGSSFRDWEDSRQRFTLKSDATYYKGRMWGANHQFKVGMIVENERYFRNLERRPTFFKSESLDPNAPPPSDGSPPGVEIFNIVASMEPDSSQRAVGTTWGVYGEDVLRPISNLSITLGLRIEQETINAPGFKPFDPQAESDGFVQFLADNPTCPGNDNCMQELMRNTFTSFEDIDAALAVAAGQFNDGATTITFVPGAHYTFQTTWSKFRQPDDINLHNINVAPRLSIGWDPWNDGKTKFSLSAGRFFDKIFLGVVTAESEPVLANFDAQSDQSRILFEPSFAYSTVDRNLKTPYNDEYSFRAERTFWQENTISLTYIHRSFKDQLQDIDINAVPGDFGKCVIQQAPQNPFREDSPGTPTLTDPFTGEVYQDTDPGRGDGRLDDCTGMTVQATDQGGGGTFAPTAIPEVARPDGFADFYVLDPAWGNIFQIGNYNKSKYDGITLEFVRRQYKNWQMEASYTWSKATGDAEDFNLALGDDRSTLQDEKGYLSFDRRHSVKLNATCLTPWGFRLGGTAQWESGLPYSILQRRASDSNSMPVYGTFAQSFTSQRILYVTHQRNDQRNVSAWNFDVKLTKEINLPKGMNLQLTADIFNLLNQDTYNVYNTFTKSGQQINGTNDATRRFGRQYQVGMRLAF